MTLMMLRNSERATFKRCEHRWQWTYRDGRQAREAALALRFGDLVHRALAPYYQPGTKRGPHPAETFVELYNADAAAKVDEGFDVYSDEKWVNALDLGTRMLEGYVERWAETDEQYEVVSSEQTFQVPLRLTGLRFKIVGTMDGVWRDRGSGVLVFAEHKTAASIKVDGLPLDEQAGTYWTYGPRWLRRRGILKPGEDISHILYNFLRKAAPGEDDVFNEHGAKLNKDGTVSKRQPAPYFARIPVYRDVHDKGRMHTRVLEEARRIHLARSGHSQLIKSPGPLHMPNCLGCPVREACEVHEAGGDYQSTLNATTAPWDPYSQHELAERS